MSRFKKATRQKLSLRMALDGPSGSGKSKTALRFAFALGRRVAAIDTENRSLSKYQGEAPDGVPFDFDVVDLPNGSPTEYIAAIEEANRESYDVLIIDSLSHAWAGEGGVLDIKDKMGSSFQNWKDVTPIQNKLIHAIVHSRCHIIATMRSKTEWIIEVNEKGKSVPRKIGMAPIQRKEVEFEFDIYGSMDQAHVLHITKSRCDAVRDAVVAFPGADFMRPVIAWLLDGAEPPPRIDPDQADRIKGLLTELRISPDVFKKTIQRDYNVAELSHLTKDAAQELESRLIAKVAKKNVPPKDDGEAGSPVLS